MKENEDDETKKGKKKVEKKKKMKDKMDKEMAFFGNATDFDQFQTEQRVLKFFDEIGFTTKDSENFKGKADYYRLKHYEFAKNLMISLPNHYSALDSGFPWLLYWVSNIISMCKDNYALDYDTKLKFVQILKELQHKDGGFCGTPKGYAHLISSYAAIMCIVNLGIKEAYDLVDIPKMKNFLLNMKNNNFDVDKKPSYVDKNGTYLITKEKEGDFLSYHTAYPGTFQNHYNGESDLRSTYCAITLASVLNLINWNDIKNDPLTKGVVENIKNCQTFEGGLGPEPYNEAHGGYTYCGVATLVLLGQLNEIDVDSLLRWLVNRQMTKEGGFNGRTNKLVDSCYSFWQASVFNLLYMSDKKYSFEAELLYDQLSLQAYILFACQNKKSGGLFDKPGKSPDLYHTNYSTAGLSLSQECQIEECKLSLDTDLDKVFEKVNPIYCTTDDNVKKAIKYYYELGKMEENKTNIESKTDPIVETNKESTVEKNKEIIEEKNTEPNTDNNINK